MRLLVVVVHKFELQIVHWKYTSMVENDIIGDLCVIVIKKINNVIIKALVSMIGICDFDGDRKASVKRCRYS